MPRNIYKCTMLNFPTKPLSLYMAKRNITSLEQLDNFFRNNREEYSARSPLVFYAKYHTESCSNVSFVLDLPKKDLSLETVSASPVYRREVEGRLDGDRYSGFVLLGFFGVPEPISPGQLRRLLHQCGYKEEQLIDSFLREGSH